MLSIILALAPLILKIGLGAIDRFSTNEKAKQDLKQALQQWFDLHKQDGAKSVAEHESFEAQEEELAQSQAKNANKP